MFSRWFLSGGMDASRLWGRLAISTIMFGISILAGIWLYRRIRLSLPVFSESDRRAGIIVFIILFSVLFVCRGTVNMRIQPPSFNYEARCMEVYANHFISFDDDVNFTVRNYNIGLSIFYIPVFALTGYNMTAAKLFYVGYHLVVLLLFAMLFRGNLPECRLLTSFLIVAPLALIHDAMRRHKWHSVMLMTALAYFVCGLGNRSRRTWIYPAVSMFLVLFAGILYRGALLCLPLVLLSMGTDRFMVRAGRKWVFILGGAVAGILIGMFIWRPYYIRPFYMRRIMYEFGVFRSLSGEMLSAWLSYFSMFRLERVFWVYPVLLWMGLVRSLVNFRSEWISRYLILGSLYWVTGMYVTKYGFRNLDEINYILLFLVGLMVGGMTLLVGMIRKIAGDRRIGFAGIWLIIAVTIWHEWDAEKRVTNLAFVEDRHPLMAVTLLHAGDLLDREGSGDIHVLDRSVLPEIYALRVYPSYRRILEHPDLRLIDSLSDLENLIRREQADSESVDIRVYMYLSQYVRERQNFPRPDRLEEIHPLGVREKVKVLNYGSGTL